MADDDRVRGADVEGEPWEAWRPHTMGDFNAVSFVVHVRNERDASHTSRALDADNSARLGSFLLSAAGIDLVSAARKVVEVRRRQDEVAAAIGGDVAITAAKFAVDEAIQALAAELAKLDVVSQ